MIILSIRTDKPEAEIGLYDDSQQLAYHTWEAHRKLAETLHQAINELLNKEGKNLQELNGIVVYEGPGSFTGLRIGISVANALAESLNLAIVAASGEGWINAGLAKLTKGENQKIVLPNYGAEPRTTTQKK